MFQTGTSAQERVATAEFPNSLISRYNPEWTLAAYCSYFELTECIEKSEKAFSAAVAATPADTVKPQPNFSAFFDMLKKSFVRVRDHLVRCQQTAAELSIALRDTKSTDLDEKTLAHAYVMLCKISQYRSLNTECFRRVFERVVRGQAGQSSLELQQKLRQADSIIHGSAIGTSPFDVDQAKSCIVSMYGLAFGHTYEQARDALNIALRQDRSAQPRVQAMAASYYYTELHRTRYVQGGFAKRLVTGTSSVGLGRDVEALMSMSAVKSSVGRFANGEVSITLDEPVRGDDVFVLQTVCACPGKKNYSMSGALMELMLLVQTARQASAKRVTAVVPFLPYNHRQAEGALIAQCLENMGINYLITCDLNREQAGGYFTVPVHNISMMPEFTRFMQKQLELVPISTEVVVVAPDGDSLRRAKLFADELSELTQRDIGLATAVKSPTMLTSASNRHLDRMMTSMSVDALDRSPCDITNNISGESSPSKSQTQQQNTSDDSPAETPGDAAPPKGMRAVDIIGKTAGRICILVDTLIDEGTKIVQVARTLHEQGAVSVVCIATHALLSGDAVRNIVESPIDMVVTSDSVNSVVDAAMDPRMARKLRIVPMAPLLTQAIMRVHENTVVANKILD